MTAPLYVERAPSASLSDIVRCFWLYRSNGAENEPQHIPPDGCCEFVVHLAAPYEERNDAGAFVIQPTALFAGQLTRPLILRAADEVAAFGVRFTPDGARGFFGAPLDSATDKRVDLSNRADVVALRRNMLAASDNDALLALLQDFAAATPRAPDDAVVREAVTALAKGESPSRGALSERQFQRRFKDRVGVSPRELASLFRFRRVFDAIEAEQTWLAAALAVGYFDQAQMARDFQRYLGISARAFAQRKLGFAALIASETYKTPAPEAERLVRE